MGKQRGSDIDTVSCVPELALFNSYVPCVAKLASFSPHETLTYKTEIWKAVLYVKSTRVFRCELSVDLFQNMRISLNNLRDWCLDVVEKAKILPPHPMTTWEVSAHLQGTKVFCD